MTVVPLAGALEIDRYPVYRRAFEHVHRIARPVVLDLGRVTRIDSTFLTKLLLLVRQRAEAGYATIVALDNPAVLRIVGLAGVAHRLTIVSDVPAATRLLSASTGGGETDDSLEA
ncbi:MAG: hypothetical protein NVS4B5_07830 [Vulcanimicrobiaceae bacterium]